MTKEEEHTFLQKQIDQIRTDTQGFFTRLERLVSDSISRIEEKFDKHNERFDKYNNDFNTFKNEIYKHLPNIEKIPVLDTKIQGHDSSIKMGQIVGGVFISIVTIALSGGIIWLITSVVEVTYDK